MSSRASPFHAHRRVVLALGGVTAAGLLGYAAYVLLGFDLGGAALYNQGAYHLGLAGATALCAARGVLVRAERTGWLALAVGMACWTAGSIVFELAFASADAAPYPSIADGLWLAFYPAAWAALVLLVRERVRQFPPSVWLDGIVGALAFAALAIALVFEPILAATSGSVAAVATNLAYPVGDTLLGAFVVGVFALLGWRPGRAWLALGAGLVLLQVADSIYLVQFAVETYKSGALDLLWPAGMAMLGIAAWQPIERRRSVRLDGGRVLLFPAAFTLLALGLLVYGNVRSLSPLALALASGTLLVAFARTALAFREVASLAESRRQAVTDALTGLPNRRLLYERIEKSIAARDPGASLAFLLIDLDGFKELNDTLGHRAGDIVLRQVGTRMREALRPEDVLARLGGDEFGVLVPAADGAAAMQVARRVQGALERPFRVDGLALHVEASIGAAAFPAHAEDADGLIQHADVAMYQAKAAKLGCELYDPARDRHSRAQLALVGGLRDAIDHGELVLHYQPKARLDTGEVIGVEALVRWQHPQQGLLVPAAFLPLAEQTGLMRPLTLHVLDRALEQCAAWRREGFELTVAVNLAVANLIDLQLAVDVQERLERFGVPPHALQLEVTENIVMTDPERGISVMSALRAVGVGLSLDDFGTGHSSLAYLKRLGVDELKIDRSFVGPMATDPDSAAIVRLTIDLARALGISAVAEGIEDAATWECLRELGCPLAQGYHLSRPLPAGALVEWLRAQPLALTR